MKKLSCGIIITDGERLLIGHVTNDDHWTIPKGKMEKYEYPIDAAVRETEEEFSIFLHPLELEELGKFEYKSYKDLYLFLYNGELPSVGLCECGSYTKQGFPEIDGYKVIPLSDYDKYFNKEMTLVFDKIFGDKI